MTLAEARVLRALAATVALVTTGVVSRTVKDLALVLHEAGVTPLPGAFKGKLESVCVLEES